MGCTSNKPKKDQKQNPRKTSVIENPQAIQQSEVVAKRMIVAEEKSVVLTRTNSKIAEEIQNDAVDEKLEH